VTPDFDRLLLGGIGLGLVVAAVFAWRFGPVRAAAFVLLAGLFPAALDFASSFAADNYVYPGQTRLWVFTYIFFGWIGVCGTCLLLAEGILAPPGTDVLTARRLRWQAPLLTAVAAVLLDLFIDPVAVAIGYWTWRVPGSLYHGIPLLNFVGWFVLMLVAPLAWIEVCRHPGRSRIGTLLAALTMLPVAGLAAVLLSVALNAVVGLTGYR
jgi:putative membrane protein